MKLLPILGGAFLTLAGLAAQAEMLESNEVAATIIGKTFHGVNENDEAFWFWHEGGPEEGTFRAKFSNDQDGTVLGEGIWSVGGTEICWVWTSWNNKEFCYNRFELDGDRLAMTRTDGEVHVGTLVPGNGEGL